MGLLDRLFGKNTDLDQQKPNISFGRYSDSHKTVEQYDSWDSALEKFDRKEYIEAYKDFFKYLRDHDEDNVFWNEESGVLKFGVLQGSKKITGQVDHHKIRVQARIVKANELNVAFLNRLITQNFNLEYSRFALDEDNCIVIVFDSFLLDGSPYKFYYALRELAINADKQDDLLLDEFDGLEPIESSHLSDLPKKEKETKFHFIKSSIENVLHSIEENSNDVEQYPGGITYLLLDLVYRLDFLVKPEGFMMETLERINRQYFAADHKSIEEKNNLIKKELDTLLKRPAEDFYKEMYRVRTTFGITKPISVQRIRGIIEGELVHMDWYYENGFENISMSIPGYIVGNCLFNYAVPKGIFELFKLYYEIMEPNYFKKLGFTNAYYLKANKKLNPKEIKNALKEIVQRTKHIYFDFSPQIGLLDFSSKFAFSKSFLIMVSELELVSKST